MLTHLRIEHFKSISDVSLNLPAVSLLVGRNSSGKSNIVESLTFLRNVVRHGLEQACSDLHGVDSVIQWSPFRPYNLVLDLKLKNAMGNGSYTLKIGSKARSPVVFEESGSWTAEAKTFSFRRDRKGLKIVYDPEDGDDRLFDRYVREKPDDEEVFISRLSLLPRSSGEGMRHIRRLLIDVEAYNIFPITLRQPQKPSSDLKLQSSGENLTSVLKTLSAGKSSLNKRNYAEILSLMKTVIPRLHRILVKNTSGLLWLVFEVSESDGRLHQFNVSQISDGALRVLGILVALYQPYPPSIIAIEEPEQNIHPGVLGMLADAFKDVSARYQIILTTHSPNLVDHFEPDSIFAVEMKDNITKVGPITKRQKRAIQERLPLPSEIMLVEGFLS